MSAPPIVSIFIPCHNYGRFLRQAIDSALAQTYPHIEILVVDDGSTDNTPDVAREVGPRLTYHRIEHGGVARARNAALDLVSGEYAVNLDADNMLEPAFVEETLRVLREQAGACAFAYTQMRFFGNSEGVSDFPPYDLQTLKMRNYIDMCALIRTDIARQFQFDDAFACGYNDYDFFLSLAEHGHTGILVDKPLLRYRTHGGGITQAVNRRYMQKKLIRRLTRKHRALYSRAEAQAALAAAANRLMVAVIHNRDPASPLAARFRDLAAFASASCIHPQFRKQILYTLRPFAGTPRDAGDSTPEGETL